MKLKILSFNWHEPYLCLLAKTSHDFLVVEPEVTPGKTRVWDENMRPLPDNVNLISLSEALELLKVGSLDLVIAHNVKDLVCVREFHLPKIMVFHNRLTTEIALGGNRVEREDYLSRTKPLFNDVQKVFISQSKKSDWGLDGDVILPGIDLSEFGKYTGETAAILRVGNLMKERDLMLGFSDSEKIVEGFPVVTLGLNPSISESRLSRGVDDLKEHYRKCRLYLNCTVDGYEDGYNLSILEAMATGMPVVSMGNSSTPIQDGVNGFVSNDIEYLRNCVKELLRNSQKAKAMGEQARRTVREKFGMEVFVESWRQTIQKAVVQFLESTGVSLNGSGSEFHEKLKKNILMNYVSYPVTTAHYLERALRKKNNVVTCGPMITNEVIEAWNLEALNWPIRPQDIPMEDTAPLGKVMESLPDGWQPDLYLWVETGLGGLPPDLRRHSFPKVCYLIDSHIHLERHKEIARQFDFVFLAQKAYVESIRSAGCKNVYWLPLACDPEIHGKVEVEKKFQVGFVGSVTPAHGRRKNLLDQIGKNFQLQMSRKFMDEMAEEFSRSEIVFNNSVRDDLNMRVFEAMCSGSLLVTDKAPESGLEDLFEDERHLVIYSDQTLVDRIRTYLNCPEERERIAENGRKEVMAKHTYDHRAEFMIETLNEFYRAFPTSCDEKEKPDSYYQNVREDILPLVPSDASCVLEIGCAAGKTGEELKKRRKVFVAGVEQDRNAAQMARGVLDDVVEGNVEEIDLPYGEQSFDCVLFADVLEHLMNPLLILKKVKKVLKPNGTIVASIPNVQYFGLINHLVEGNWTYQKEGILDETHLRFFTFREIEKLFSDAGFEIEKVDETLDPKFEKFNRNENAALKVGRITIEGLSSEEFRRFFVFQYKVVARARVLTPEDADSFEGNDAGKGIMELLERGKLFERDKKFPAAIKLYHRVQKHDGRCCEAFIREGNCQMHLGNPEAARSLYEKVLDMEPKNFEALFGLSLLEIQDGQWDAAIMGFEMLVKVLPDSDRALSGLGLAFRGKGSHEEAMSYFVRALDLNIENDTALKNLLELAYDQNEFSQSERILKKYLDRYPANMNVLFGLAGILYKMNRWDEVSDTLDMILMFDPKHEDALNLRDRIEASKIALGDI